MASSANLNILLYCGLILRLREDRQLVRYILET
jgi:hypothetical protein